MFLYHTTVLRVESEMSLKGSYIHGGVGCQLVGFLEIDGSWGILSGSIL